ncbi:unnamed protein product [Pieris macdunnoughi]|uniref:Uncharacterized protein n=1 Tax=Pieris macdunnoughi TaxID=345717 RepID=A0A821VLG1_9NEOP|nr:unnamed protein product [Pieris macdunnoughi]
MFKLVVLSALLAAAVATPGAFITPFAPLTYTSTVVSPATTTITNQASSVIHPSPLVYSSPLAYSAYPAYTHLIKKRSAPLAVSTYIAPSPYLSPWTTYSAPITTIAASPIATAYTSPFYRTAPVLATTHFIKKRSASLLVPSTYIAPTYARFPLVSTYAAASPIISTPLISHAPIAYTHFIKKRSVAIPFIAPTAYSHTSRVDFRSTPAVSTYTTYSAPLTYSSPVLTHLY